MQPEDKKLFCLNRIKQLHPEIKVDRTSELSVDGITGYELSNKKYDQDEKIYQAILFSDNLYYIMIGSGNTGFAKNLEIFKSLTRTFNVSSDGERIMQFTEGRTSAGLPILITIGHQLIAAFVKTEALIVF